MYLPPKITFLASALGLSAAFASPAQAEVVYTVKNPAQNFTLFIYVSPTFITTDTMVAGADLAYANLVSTIASVDFIPSSSSLTHPGTSELVVFGEPEGTAFRYYPQGTFTQFGVTPGEKGSFGFPNSELVVGAPQVQFWDGATTVGDGTIHGGTGTWKALTNNWTSPDGQVNTPWQSGFGIFAGTASTVTVDRSRGAISVVGMQFAVDGYSIGGDPIALVASQTTIRVGDGTQAGAGFSATIGSVLEGRGGLVKTDLGKLILSGASTYTGPTSVNAGILEVDGSLVSAVTVNGGGRLEGTGTVGGLSIMNGGVVLPGDAIGTLNVNGNVAFAAGSTYQVEVNAAGQGSKIIATGKATLNGGTVQVTADPGTYNASLRYTILTSNGGVSGTFASLSATSNFSTGSVFLTPALSYDANDVFLGFAQTTPLTSLALTRNEFSTAAAIQLLGPGNTIFNSVVTQTTAAGARQAFDALSGEIHASAVTAAFGDQRLPREAILDRLSQPADQPVLGAATTMTGAYAADLPSHKSALAPVAAQMVRPRLFGLWGQGFGDWGRTNGDHNAAKLTRDTGGFVIGIDAERQLLNGDWRIGTAGGYTDDSLKVSARSSSGDYQSAFGALYGKASYGAIDVKAGAILASTNTRTNRSIIFPGFVDAASSSYGGYAAQGFGELGYNLPFHWTVWSYVPGLEGLKVNYEPFLQGAMIHLDQNRYVDTALTGAALVGATKGYDLGTTTLGWRTQYQLASLPGFTLSTLLGWRHAFGDVRPTVTQSFAASFASFTVAGVPVDRDALVSEASLNYAVSNSVTVGLSYSGQYGRRASDNAFKGHIDVNFW
jgi:outer membrane autotransporter protein